MDRTGKLVTIVFRITDDAEFSTLRMVGEKWKGMESVGISVGDLIHQRQQLRDLVTTEHESQHAFIRRVNAVLNTPVL